MEECFAWRSAWVPVVFSGFINSPGNIQKMSVTFAGATNLGETHVPESSLLEFRVILRNWRYCPKGKKVPVL